MCYKSSFVPYRFFIYSVVSSGMVHIALWFCPNEDLIAPILGCDIVYLMSWNGPYHVLKWCFSGDGKVTLNVSCWYSVVCTWLLFFAYLRPKESPFANLRLFFFGGGKPENSNRKSEKYRKSVTHQFKIQTRLCIPQ